MDFTIAVATFGGRHWRELAEHRAIPSAEAQGVPVVYAHERTLAEARNGALAKVKTEGVIHLDADDELEPGYVEAMSEGTADLRAPAVRHIWPSWESEPEVPRVWSHEHQCVADCLRFGNWLCIGTAARADLLREVGGWEEFGWSEDWAMFARTWYQGGATVEAIPGAIYRAHHRPRSRNRVNRREGLRWHRAIERSVFGEVTV